MTSLPEYLLVILAAALLYGLTWRNRLIRDPASGHTKSFWLTAEAVALIDQLRLREGRLPELPRWHGPVPRWDFLVIRIDPPLGIADAARFSLHFERRTGAYWLKQRGGILGSPIIFGPGVPG